MAAVEHELRRQPGADRLVAPRVDRAFGEPEFASADGEKGPRHRAEVAGVADLVEDEEAAEKKKAELAAELAAYQQYRRELNEIILQMLRQGGLKIYVP